MARRFTKAELREKLHTGVQKFTASEGIENLTTRKIAKAAGLSEPYIYQCFEDVPNLLEDCFLKIDKEIGGFLNSVIDSVNFRKNDGIDAKEKCWLLWSAYWDFLIKNSDRTLFYWRFYQSMYYTQSIIEQRRSFYENLIDFIGEITKKYSLNEYADINLMIVTMIDSTVLSAVRIIRGEGEATPMGMQTIFNIMFAQIFNILETAKSNKKRENIEESK